LPLTADCATPVMTLTASIQSEVPALAPVPVQLTLEYKGQTPLTVLRFPDSNSTSVEIRGIGNTKPIYKGRIQAARASVRERPEPPPTTFKPGEQYSFQVLLKCKSSESQLDGPMFSKPGAYQCRFVAAVTYLDGVERNWFNVESDWLNVRVVQPPDSTVIKDLVESPHFCWLFEPKDSVLLTSTEEQKAWAGTLESFLQKHPRSYWSPYAHFAAAHVYEARALRSAQDIDVDALNMALFHINAAAEAKGFHDAEHARKMQKAIEKKLSDIKKP